MLSEKRMFAGLIMSSPKLDSPQDILKSFPPHSVELSLKYESPDEELLNSSFFESSDWVYYSQERYSTAAELENVLVERRGRKYFSYPLLITRIQLHKHPSFLLAAPFSRLVEHIMKDYLTLISGMGFTFASIDLRAARSALVEGRHGGGAVKLRGVDYLVLGDPGVDGLRFRGKDLVNSEAHKVTDQIRFESVAAEKPRITLREKRLTIAYDSGEQPAFALKADRYGNLRFHIGSRRKNLVSAERLFRFLQAEGLLTMTTALPVDRVDQEEDEDHG